MNPKAVGERTEAIILAHLIVKGYSVLVPFGNNQRYDLVADIDGKLIRGQCKTAVYRRGCVRFHTCSTNGFTGKKTSYKGQIDVFWVYCPEITKIYQVPVNHVGSVMALLRVEKPVGGSKSNIRWAKPYEI